MSDATRYSVFTNDLANPPVDESPAVGIVHVVLASDYDRDTQALQRRVLELTNLVGEPQCFKVEHMALTARLAACQEALKAAPTGSTGETHGDVIARYYQWYEGIRAKALAQEGEG